MTWAFVSRDMASVALGANTIAAALEASDIEVIRTGSHGLFSIEPLVEIETSDGRVAFGPIAPSEIASVLDGTHRNRIGSIAAHPFFAGQQT